MKKYKYQGKTEIVLAGYGVVSPGQIIETEAVINHPLFREIKTKEK
jgi:hypothetical protein